MDDMTLLMVVAGIMTTIAFVMMYRDAKEQKEIFEAQEAAEAEAEAEEAKAKKSTVKKSGKKW